MFKRVFDTLAATPNAVSFTFSTLMLGSLYSIHLLSKERDELLALAQNAQVTADKALAQTKKAMAVTESAFAAAGQAQAVVKTALGIIEPLQLGIDNDSKQSILTELRQAAAMSFFSPLSSPSLEQADIVAPQPYLPRST